MPVTTALPRPWRACDPLPAVTVLDGVEVGILSAADYRDFIAWRAREVVAPTLKVREVLSRRSERKGLSTIERDAEVAEFLTGRFRGRETLAQLRAACIERFGADRTPSIGRIGVFRQRWDA